MQIESIRVERLFGYLDHDVEFREGSPTILAGPNGSGKTHLLKILSALVALRFDQLTRLPFSSAELRYRNRGSLRVEKTEDGDVLFVEGRDSEGQIIAGELVAQVSETELSELPPWLERMGMDEWFDSRTGTFLSRRDINREFASIDSLDELIQSHPWLSDFQTNAPPTFIETGRLDTIARMDGHKSRIRGRPTRTKPAIDRYIERVRQQIAEARRESLSKTQVADRRFPAKALDRSRKIVGEEVLRRKYAEISALHQELQDNGLTDQTFAVEFPSGEIDETERRILNVFLEDWENKLAPLKPVHAKLRVLRSIVEAKIVDKSLRIEGTGDISFISPAEAELSVSALSSGEQHMIALFTMLLFGTDPHSLVLIDEPEISLHAAWKHEFLLDLERVSELIPVTVVLATHSTSLINSRWDLVEELDLGSHA